MTSPFLARSVAAGLCLLAVPGAVMAQTTGTSCGDLVKKYDEAIGTADGLVSTAVDRALKSTDPSGLLQQLGLSQSLSPEQAVRRGALAALPPPTQAAVQIYLLRANTAMQALIWKGCRPPQDSSR